MRRSDRTRRIPLAALGLLAAALLTAATARADQEAWDAIYVGNSKVGHIHLWIKPVKDSNGRELVNVRIDYELTFRRGRDTAKMRMIYGTIETPEGEVLRLDTVTQAGGQNIRVRGDVVEGKMPLSLEVGGKVTQKVVDWAPDVRGPYGAEMSLSREPLEPGETREVRTFIPDLNKVCLTRLEAKEMEDVPLGTDGKSHSLLRVQSTLLDADGKTPVPGMASTLWVDASGQILKSKTDMLGGMYTYRTTKEGALSENRTPYQLLDNSILKTPQPISTPDRTRSVLYRISGGDPGKLFPNDHRQAVTVESDTSATILVKTDDPNSGAGGPAEVDAEYLRANPLVNSESPIVVRRMKEAIGNATDPWSRAVKIQEWVSQNVKDKNFSTAFAPAEEVARELSGDCTEHGVLTAAMCRAAGVPARCVVGLVYAPDQGGFGPHMWNEVYVNGRWVAIDAAFDQSQVDATHIKLSETSLDGVAPFESFLPVLQVLQSMKIDPIEIR